MPRILSLTSDRRRRPGFCPKLASFRMSQRLLTIMSPTTTAVLCPLLALGRSASDDPLTICTLHATPLAHCIAPTCLARCFRKDLTEIFYERHG